MDLPGDWRGGVCVGALTDKLGPEVLPPQVVVLHGVHHRPVGRQVVGAVVDAALLPPGDAGAGGAPGDLADNDQVVANLQRPHLGPVQGHGLVEVPDYRPVGGN